MSVVKTMNTSWGFQLTCVAVAVLAGIGLALMASSSSAHARAHLLVGSSPRTAAAPASVLKELQSGKWQGRSGSCLCETDRQVRPCTSREVQDLGSLTFSLSQANGDSQQAFTQSTAAGEIRFEASVAQAPRRFNSVQSTSLPNGSVQQVNVTQTDSAGAANSVIEERVVNGDLVSHLRTTAWHFSRKAIDVMEYVVVRENVEFSISGPHRGQPSLLQQTMMGCEARRNP